MQGTTMKLSQLVIALLLLLPLPASAAVKVVATLPSLAAIAREVGGADATVESMLPPNIDPHFADAKPSLVVTLSRADLLVENGLELEVGWLPALVQQSRNAKLAPGANGRFDASTVVRRLEVPRGAVDRAQGDVHPGGNPHFLYDPRAGAAIARALATRLASIDPTHAAGYQSRAAAMATELESFGRAQTAAFAALPAPNRAVVTYHRSLIYLCDWLGLTSPISVEPRPGVAPNPAHVAKVLAQLKTLPKRVILQEEFYPTSTTNTLARLGSATLISIEGGTRFDKGKRYIDHLRAISDPILAALSR